jgi:hypothetical protein
MGSGFICRTSWLRQRCPLARPHAAGPWPSSDRNDQTCVCPWRFLRFRGFASPRYSIRVYCAFPSNCLVSISGCTRTFRSASNNIGKSE